MEVLVEKVLPNLMPAHKSKKITVAQVRRAILKVEADRKLARQERRRKAKPTAESPDAEG